MSCLSRKIGSCLLLTGLFAVAARAQTCPPNIDFEQGDLTNWECRTGRVDDLSGVNTITWLQTGQLPDNHKIISRATAGFDQYGNFPEVPPNGSGYSVKLGSYFFPTNISAEGISYTFTVPNNAQSFSIIYYYAVVFQDPQHQTWEQPRFRARLYNVTDNSVINCSDFDYTASASLPGFQVSTVDPTVIYKDWTPVTLNLSGQAGKTLRLEFITSDCTFKGHFGYAYIDVSSSCSGAISGSQVCPGATGVTLTAPHGFQTYTWYTDNSFSTVLASGQVLTLNPVPPVGTILPVVVGPYPGFGCPDTLRAVLSEVAAPVANAGPDMYTCPGKTVSLGSSPVENYGYSWTPASLLINPLGANPMTIYNLNDPTTFYLTVTDNITGCTDHDTVNVDITTIDTTMFVTGDTSFCMYDPVNTEMQLATTDGSIQWFENWVAVNGATAAQFNPQPTTSVIYHARITKGGCELLTRPVIINLHSVPEAVFSTSISEQCINGPVAVLNESKAPPGFDNSYLWELSDGRTFNSKDLALTFGRQGRVDISLKAISVNGCRDSTSGSILIVEKCGVYVPSAFTPGSDGKNDLFRPVFYGVLKLRRFSVYDRGGYRVFSTSTAGEGWNGRHKGEAVPTSVLIWTLEYESETGELIYQKGTVLLVR